MLDDPLAAAPAATQAQPERGDKATPSAQDKADAKPARKRARRRNGGSGEQPSPPREAAAPAAGTADTEPLKPLYARVPLALTQRLDTAVFVFKRRRKTSQQEVVAALLWRYVNPREASSLDAIEELVAAYREAIDAEVFNADEIKALYPRVPVSLADRLDTLVFNLKRRRKTSQQEVVAALLWRYVDGDDPKSLDELEELLGSFRAASA